MKINYKNRFPSNLQIFLAPTYYTIHSTKLSSSEILWRKYWLFTKGKKTLLQCFKYYAQINTLNTVVNFTVFEKIPRMSSATFYFFLDSFPLCFFVNGSLSKPAHGQKFIKPCVYSMHRLISEITHSHILVFITTVVSRGQ